MAGRKTAAGRFAYEPSTMRFVVLHGDDDFQIRERTKEIADALRGHFGDIETFSYDGQTARLADVLDELRSYGLIQRHKFVILDDADEFLKEPKDKDSDAPAEDPSDERGDEPTQPVAAGPQTSNRPAMERYAAAPVDHATLLMRARTWRAGKIDKTITKVGLIYKAQAPTEQRAVDWVVSRSKKRHGCEIEPTAAALLVAQTGAQLGRLDIELGKLAAYVGGGQRITREAVGEMVGLSREEKVWSLQSAIASGKPERALAKLRELMDVSRQHEVLVLWAIMDLLRKTHTAAHLLDRGAAPYDVSRQLKLWGDSQSAVIGAAKSLSPHVAADLLDQAVKTDRANKGGFGDPVRSLEALTLRIADTIGRGRS